MVGSPAWSPNGSQIAFDVHIGDHAQIFVADVASGLPRQITRSNASNIVPAWSPDGRWVYYTSTVTGTETVWRVPANGGEPSQITRRGGYSVKVSPDGKYLFYLRNSREGELWRVSAEGGQEGAYHRRAEKPQFLGAPRRRLYARPRRFPDLAF